MATPSTAITRVELSSTFSEFDLTMSQKGFIGQRVLRPRMVGTQSADIGKIPLAALLQTRDDARAPRAGYNRGDFTFDKFSYATRDHGLEEPIDDRELSIFRDILDAEAIHTARAEDGIARNYELAVAAAIYDTAVWTGAALTSALGVCWDVAATAVPINDIQAARLKVIDGSGLEPNALIVNRKQFFHIKNCDQIVDRVKFSGHTDPRNITPQAIAEALDLDHVLVAGGIKNTADEGQAASIGSVWSDSYSMLARVATTDDPAEPCIGRTFLWSEDGPGAPGSDEAIAILVEEYREESVRGSVIRARTDYDLQIMYAAAGHLLTGILT